MINSAGKSAIFIEAIRAHLRGERPPFKPCFIVHPSRVARLEAEFGEAAITALKAEGVLIVAENKIYGTAPTAVFVDVDPR